MPLLASIFYDCLMCSAAVIPLVLETNSREMEDGARWSTSPSRPAKKTDVGATIVDFSSTVRWNKHGGQPPGRRRDRIMPLCYKSTTDSYDLTYSGYCIIVVQDQTYKRSPCLLTCRRSQRYGRGCNVLRGIDLLGWLGYHRMPRTDGTFLARTYGRRTYDVTAMAWRT
jgi:hypothetical protein